MLHQPVLSEESLPPSIQHINPLCRPTLEHHLVLFPFRVVRRHRYTLANTFVVIQQRQKGVFHLVLAQRKTVLIFPNVCRAGFHQRCYVPSSSSPSLSSPVQLLLSLPGLLRSSKSECWQRRCRLPPSSPAETSRDEFFLPNAA
nr:hypothetical protein Iba_chr06aCG6290 [Ipomoea batatas]GMD03169.1 hypothetical protein Iba_chr06aCG6300 [Ipomoea batatas]GMD06690.1 hypothetical protein Iba_chr06cCG0030 [Ipomoea batatas]GMD11634.1 hypothetical protein Iba_chr06fCG5620 [Ipomoea batatas]